MKPQHLNVLVALVDNQHSEYTRVLWHHSIVRRLLGDKHQNLMRLRCLEETSNKDRLQFVDRTFHVMQL